MPISSRRFLWREMTPRRVLDAVGRRIGDVPHSLAWHGGLSGSKDNRKRLEAFAGRHAGERCVILANGPSLATTDLTRVDREVTFGMNRVYLLFQEFDFRPTYYVAVNELVLRQFRADVSELDMPRFLNWNTRSAFDRDDPRNHFLRLSLGVSDSFKGDATRSISAGGTVTFVTMQLAFFMGFEKVILVGLDHSFGASGVPNATEVRRDAEDTDHFHPDYFPKGSRWQLPDLLRSEQAYRLALQAFEADGRTVIDATAGGKCDVFPKMSLDEALG